MVQNGLLNDCDVDCDGKKRCMNDGDGVRCMCCTRCTRIATDVHFMGGMGVVIDACMCILLSD